MAISATISLNLSTVTIHQPVMAAVTISNSGGSPVTVSGIAPSIVFTGDGVTEDASSYSISNPPTVNPSNNVVPAGGSLICNFPLVVHAPSTGVTGTGSGTYNVGCIVYTSDGSVTAPTATTLTVNPVLPIF